MKFELTQKDKKVLFILAIFVVVIVIGYWGIYPNVKAIRKINKNIETEKDKQTVLENKASLIPMLENDQNELQQKLSEIKDEFSPIIQSDKVDKYFTGMALEYNLEVYDFSISMPKEPVALEPYMYSKKMSDQQNAEDIQNSSSSLVTSGEYNSEDYMNKLENDLYSNAETSNTMASNQNIYCVRVSMTLGGEEKDIEDLVEYFSQPNEKIRLVSYKWNSTKETTVNENGNYEISSVKQLNICLDMYMCKE